MQLASHHLYIPCAGACSSVSESPVFCPCRDQKRDRELLESDRSKVLIQIKNASVRRMSWRSRFRLVHHRLPSTRARQCWSASRTGRSGGRVTRVFTSSTRGSSAVGRFTQIVN